MKATLIQTDNNQHVVAIQNASELRAYFVNSSAHTAAAVKQTLESDSYRFGQDVGEQADFFNLPLINTRIAKSGRKMYSIAQ